VNEIKVIVDEEMDKAIKEACVPLLAEIDTLKTQVNDTKRRVLNTAITVGVLSFIGGAITIIAVDYFNN